MTGQLTVSSGCLTGWPRLGSRFWVRYLYRISPASIWFSNWGLNLSPHACKVDPLPTELPPALVFKKNYRCVICFAYVEGRVAVQDTLHLWPDAHSLSTRWNPTSSQPLQDPVLPWSGWLCCVSLSWWTTWSAASSLESTLCPGRLWGQHFFRESPIAKDGPVWTSLLNPHQPCPRYHISFRCLEAIQQVHNPVGVLLDFPVIFTLQFSFSWKQSERALNSSYLWLLLLRVEVMFSPFWGTLRNQTRIIETDHWTKALVTNPTNLTSVPRTHVVSRENWLPLSSDLHTHILEQGITHNK